MVLRQPIALVATLLMSEALLRYIATVTKGPVK